MIPFFAESFKAYYQLGEDICLHHSAIQEFFYPFVFGKELAPFLFRKRPLFKYDSRSGKADVLTDKPI